MACGTAADLKKRSIFTYHRVLLFNYDVQCRKPFRSYNRSVFGNEDIDPSWYTGPLTRANRKIVKPMVALGGGRFSVFAKIEIGTCAKRRESIEEDLNSTFQEMLDQDFRIDEAYRTMVEGKPSKVLSSWTYQVQPQPLRSSRTAGEFRETEVPDTEDESARPTDFQEFTTLLLNGQRIADKSGKAHFFTWRGYQGCVSSEIPRFTTKEITRRYKLAMESIEKRGVKKEFFETTKMSSASGRSSSSSSAGSSSTFFSEDPQHQSQSQELTQIPATQLPASPFAEVSRDDSSAPPASAPPASAPPVLASSASAPPASASSASAPPASAPPALSSSASMPPPLTPPAPKRSKLSKKKHSENFITGEENILDEDGVADEAIEQRGEKEKSSVTKDPIQEQDRTLTALQNVKVTLQTLESSVTPQNMFSNSVTPLIGHDGKPIKTSVCDEIEASVKRAADIEKQLAHSKDNYESYEQQLEEEQDFMGLYESEISRQMHLRNRQKKEWQMIKKKMENSAPTSSKGVIPDHVEKQLQDDKRKEDRRELEETVASKQLAAAMMKSVQNNADDTLHKVVELLNNQNAHIITMKRNTKTLVQSSKLQAERDKVLADNQAKVTDIAIDMQKILLRLSTQLDMRKKVNIDDFIPINTDHQLTQFLDKKDGQFQDRREAFENVIYCSVTKNLRIKRPFETHFLASVFGREYIRSHKWPGPGIDSADQDIIVPEEFTILLKVTLSKMVAAKCLNPDLVNLDFWRRIPNKFKGIRIYEDRKMKIRELASLKSAALSGANLALQPQHAPSQQPQADTTPSPPPQQQQQQQQAQQQQQQHQPETAPSQQHHHAETPPSPPQQQQQQQQQAPLKQKYRLSKRNYKGKPKAPKKQNTTDKEPMGELIGEEEEQNFDDSGFQNSQGESIYEELDNPENYEDQSDFDEPHYY